MSNFNSHLQVLICTIAFGMGIDCKAVCCSIHFGPSRSIGRGGKQCFCYVFFNGLLTAHCEPKVKELIEFKTCRKKFISELFAASCNRDQPAGCLCCDVCRKNDKDPNSAQMMKFE